MSQVATLYPVSSDVFNAIKTSISNREHIRTVKNYVSFQGTHEGLRFVLSKGKDKKEIALINEIFYSTSYIGETSYHVFPKADEVHEFMNLREDDDIEELGSEPISYLDLDKIKQIAVLLNTISNDDFISEFDPEELNREKIYPCCWNNKPGENQIYNRKHILHDFQHLKEMFKNANNTNDYILCCVG